MKEIYDSQTKEFVSLKGSFEFAVACGDFVYSDKQKYEEAIWDDEGTYTDGRYSEYYDYSDSKDSKD